MLTAKSKALILSSKVKLSVISGFRFNLPLAIKLMALG
jgi:hypothetical protein